MVIIEKRALSVEEIETLITEIKGTPNIIGVNARAWKSFGSVFIAYLDNEFAGICATSDIGGNWSDLAIVFVREKFRGQKIGTQLLEEAWRYLTKRHRHIYAVSRNPLIISWMKAKGMRVISFWQLPMSVIWDELSSKLSLYRLKEFFRKKRAFPNQSKFIYAIKLAS